MGSIKRKIDYLYNELFSSDKNEESSGNLRIICGIVKRGDALSSGCGDLRFRIRRFLKEKL